MSFLLDTNVISELRKGGRAHTNLTAWYDTVTDDKLFLSVLVIGEIRKGAERVRSRDPARAQSLENWLAALRRRFQERILSIDDRIADEWGRLSGGRTVPVIDGLLAATAKTYGLTLVTRNLADVAALGAMVLDPFAKQ